MAMEFSNNGGGQRLASVASFPSPGTSVSFSFWTRITSLAANVRRFLGSATQFEIRGGNTAGTQAPGLIVNDLYNTSDGAQSTTLLTVGPWFYIAATGEFTGGSSITDVYVNGVFEATLTIAGVAIAAATMTIGNRTGTANSEGLNGLLDDVRIYNRRLSAIEIQTIYATRGTDGIVDGLVLRTQLEEGTSGSSPAGAGFVKDLSNNKNDYTPTGSPVYRESVLRFRRRQL